MSLKILSMFCRISLTELVKLLFIKEKINVFPFFVTRYPLRQWLLLNDPVLPKIKGGSALYQRFIVPERPPVAKS